MAWKILVPVAWTLAALEFLGLLYAMVGVSTERSQSPEAGRGLGIFAVGFVMVLLAAVSGLLFWSVRKHQIGGLIAATVLLAYPAVFLVADPAIRAYKKYKFDDAEAAVGDFPDALKPLAQAIRSSDSATLKTLLNSQPAPTATDRAGNDLLTYSLITLAARQGDLACTRVLLEAGADARKPRTVNGLRLLDYLIIVHPPSAAEAVALMLKSGADPNAMDPQSSDTLIRRAGEYPEIVRSLVEAGADFDKIGPDGINDVLHLTGVREWESAIYLVEKGARLDVRNEHGLSLDYYLDDWKESVNGEHPEGWDRLRAAIAKRRGK